MKSILVTDSLFILPEHEEKLRDAGFEIERLDKPEATEEELIKAIKGKDGYILGGIETITERIIDAGDNLKAIVFTGIGYKDLIPCHEYATSKGIAIANTPDAPTHAVAEWAMTMALAMNRNIFDLGRVGEKKFITSKGIENQHVGIVGLGRIGKEIAEMLKPFRPASISYFSKHAHENSQIEYKELDNLLQESDIVFLCVSKDAGKNFFGKDQLKQMKNDSLLVSFMAPGIIDEDALLAELKTGRIRGVSDHPIHDEESNNLPRGTWYCFNASNAFNTTTEIKLCSDTATYSMINLLTTGQDKNKVN
ncbi:MAG: NAD(P)-dependent oxidoreductase [Candidatus Paceibacterota bacterium]